MSDGVAEDGINGAVVFSKDFGIGGVVQLRENVGGDADGFGGWIRGFGGEDAEGADLMIGITGVEMEIEGELAGVGRDGFVENEKEAF